MRLVLMGAVRRFGTEQGCHGECPAIKRAPRDERIAAATLSITDQHALLAKPMDDKRTLTAPCGCYHCDISVVDEKKQKKLQTEKLAFGAQKIFFFSGGRQTPCLGNFGRKRVARYDVTVDCLETRLPRKLPRSATLRARE